MGIGRREGSLGASAGLVQLSLLAARLAGDAAGAGQYAATSSPPAQTPTPLA